jgi:hypothetical protein
MKKKRPDMKKKGAVFDVFTFMVIGFILLLLFAGIIYGWGIITDQLETIEIDLGNGDNFSSIVQNTAVPLESAFNELRLFAFIIIFSSIISIFIFNYLEKSDPIFFAMYWLIGVPAIIMSAYISNRYEDVLYNSALSSTLTEFTASNYFMLYLPYFVTVIVIIGGIFLVLGMNRQREETGGII